MGWTGRGEGGARKAAINPMHRQSSELPALASCQRCGAKTRSGKPCLSPAIKSRSRCRMHGGAKGSGAPEGRRNGRFRHGAQTRRAIRERARLRVLLALSRTGLND